MHGPIGGGSEGGGNRILTGKTCLGSDQIKTTRYARGKCLKIVFEIDNIAGITIKSFVVLQYDYILYTFKLYVQSST